MKIPVWTVDSFTNKAFSGNPAAVCLLDTVLPDTVKQMIAAELALSETCFLEPPSGVAADSAGRRFSLRWFTPAIEVPLCGHATLAAAAVLYQDPGSRQAELQFETASGLLTARRQGQHL